ncbi:BTAD domain-containing putative transcriptional regulator [Actinoplanes sp. NPDC051861]|uniref:BTAD domain-containing putative transcriptional regulator n=1 Tax=Actinoplanes sp. NPDC051861 TaxID=3155170 RepID=UPI00343F40CF
MDIAVLGPVEVRAGTGERIPIVGARLRTLMILLALDAGRIVSADRLIDGIWGDDAPSGAGNALQALVSRLRRAVPELRVEASPHGYRLVIDPDLVDAHRFARLAAEAPGRALELWRGELEFPGAAEADAVRLTRLRTAAHRDWLAREMAHRDVVPELEALVAAHPLDEALIALLLRALRQAGSPGRALQVFEDARRRLADQLGADPSPELAALHLDLLRADDRRGNLPAELSSFIGRDAEVRAVRELTTRHRLVTLTGPGGSGKTRLSVEVGAGLPGEVWRVELAPVRDPAEVVQAILTALHPRTQMVLSRIEPATPLSRLRDALKSRDLLLILDNCEHVITAAAETADVLLRAAPGLRLIATSREPLGIPGERIFPVEPLASPPLGADAAAASVFPSVRLMLDRSSGLALSDANVEPVVRICQALDGMPLAIELAAARLRTLPVAVLADRLADRFRLLTGGSRTALPRHQTLRAVVDWSWDLLTEPERRLWRGLAALPGGADVTAAERVCAADPDLLGALVDKSLLVLGPDGRYRMLETIREYGLERLDEAGETEDLRRSLADHLLELAREAEPHLRRAEQLSWLRRLSAEHDNLHAAVRGAIAAGDSRTAAALVANLGWYWWLRGHRVEGSLLSSDVAAMDTGGADRSELALTYAYAALNGVEGPTGFAEVEALFLRAEELAQGTTSGHPLLRLLTPLAAVFSGRIRAGVFGGADRLFDDPDPWLRAVAQMVVGHVRINFGESAEAAEADLSESLAGFRAVGERWGIGFTLSILADMAAARGDFARAVEWQREAFALVEDVGMREDLPQLAVKLAHQMWMSGDRAEAHRTLTVAREHARRAAVPEVMATVHHGESVIARAEGRLDEARAHNDEAIRLIETSTFAPQFGALARSNGGLIEGAAGDLVRARELHREALEIAVRTKDSPVIAEVLVGFADLVLREGDTARAAGLLGAADSVRGSKDRSVGDAERIAGEARAALGGPGFETAYRRGDGVTVATALEAALEGPVRRQ